MNWRALEGNGIMSQGKETKEDLRVKLAAADRAGLTLARCFKWDREEYQSNPRLVKAVEADEIARKWVDAVRGERQQGGAAYKKKRTQAAKVG